MPEKKYSNLKIGVAIKPILWFQFPSQFSRIAHVMTTCNEVYAHIYSLCDYLRSDIKDRRRNSIPVPVFTSHGAPSVLYSDDDKVFANNVKGHRQVLKVVYVNPRHSHSQVLSKEVVGH